MKRVLLVFLAISFLASCKNAMQASLDEDAKLEREIMEAKKDPNFIPDAEILQLLLVRITSRELELKALGITDICPRKEPVYSVSKGDCAKAVITLFNEICPQDQQKTIDEIADTSRENILWHAQCESAK